MANTPRRNPPPAKPVTVTTKTKTTHPPATTPTKPPRQGTHAVTTSMEPAANWADQDWPPVDNLPELSGFTVADSQAPQEPQPLTTASDIQNVQFNDYNAGTPNG